MNWCESSEKRAEQKRLVREAVEEYSKTPLDYTAAVKEWARKRNLKEDYLILNCEGGIPTEKKAKQYLGATCPKCDSALELVYGGNAFPMCGRANPKRYTGSFICTNDDCFWHVFLTEGLTDIFNKLKRKKFDEISFVKGEV